MAERGNFRGRGRGGGGDRGGRGGGRGGAAGGGGGERPSKQPILDLEKYMNQELLIKFTGGRQGRSTRKQNATSAKKATLTNARTVTGILKGYDTLMSLVLDDTKEMLQGKMTSPLYFVAKASNTPTNSFALYINLQAPTFLTKLPPPQTTTATKPTVTSVSWSSAVPCSPLSRLPKTIIRSKTHSPPPLRTREGSKFVEG